MTSSSISNGARTPLTIVHAASEVVGFAKTGGLADVVGSLPAALSNLGHRCIIFMPLYKCIRAGIKVLTPTRHVISVPIADRIETGRLWQAQLPATDVTVYMVEKPEYFERDDSSLGKGLYQYTSADGEKTDYPDNCERFVFFCRAVLEALPLLPCRPDVLHLHDWQTGLAPVYLDEIYRHRGTPENRELYQQLRTLFSIHNLAYQGTFWHWDMPILGLDWKLFNAEQLEFYGHINFLKAGVVFADLLTTVSPTYAKEIQTPYYGCGLQGVLSQRRQRLHGIVNGVDYQVWNPAGDRFLSANYDVASVTEGKAISKAHLQRTFELALDPGIPLLGIVSRLVQQKGLDLIGKTAASILESGTQLVVLGEGNPEYHQMLEQLRNQFPRQVGLFIGHNEALAHQVEAGADIFLMPSQYEPCGLNQLYSLKYGTVPIVRCTGGLADTVVDTTMETLAAGTATGFSFIPYTPRALLETVQRALEMFRTQPEHWCQLMHTGMKQDWSWNRSAREYESLYRQLVQSKSGKKS